MTRKLHKFPKVSNFIVLLKIEKYMKKISEYIGKLQFYSPGLLKASYAFYKIVSVINTT